MEMDVSSKFAYSICIPLIIALFAIAFPLLSQTISRIDNKYHSTRLTEVFYKENINRSFISVLIASLVSIPLWIFRLPRNIEIGHFNFLIDHSAIIFLLLSTVLLVVMLFMIANLIRSYYNPTKLLKRLIEKHNKSIDERRRSYYLAISDILFFSIQQKNEDLAKKLVMFYAANYVDFRKDKKGQVVKYPDEYYVTTYEANELLCLTKRKTISYYNNSMLINLFFDNFHTSFVSEDTFKAIWVCLRQAINFDRDDIIFSYWKAAEHYFQYFLPKIHENREDFKVTNGTEVTNREMVRERFLEFHYALGGLLMYTKKYTLLSRLLKFTNSIPPKYVLVPETLVEVINRDMLISKDEPFSLVHYHARYSYPEVDGVNSNDIIRMWIRKYLALLLLRQYTLQDNHHGRSVLDKPNLPNTLSELSSWKTQLVFLKKSVKEILKSDYILKNTGLSHLNEEWFVKSKKQNPFDLITELIDNAESKYINIKDAQPISELKRKDFLDQSKKIIVDTLDSLSKIITSSQIIENSNSQKFGGMYHLLDKGGFAEDQDVSYTGSGSAVALSLSANIQLNLSYTFLTASLNRYSFKPEDIFAAIDRMNFTANDYIIIALRVNLEYLAERFNVKGFRKDGDKFYFNEIEIINLDTYVNPEIYNSFFVIHKEDLPILKFNKPDENERKKFDLKPLDKEINLYASLLDMNDYPNLAKESIVSGDATNLSQKVLACLSLKMELLWKDTARCYHFKIYYHTDSGTPNTLNDLEPLPDIDNPESD